MDESLPEHSYIMRCATDFFIAFLIEFIIFAF